MLPPDDTMAKSNRPTDTADDVASAALAAGDSPKPTTSRDVEAQMTEAAGAWAKPDRGEAPSVGHVLVFNSTSGFRGAHMSETVAGKTVAFVMDLMPGLNFVDPKMWERAEARSKIGERIEMGEIEVLAGPKGVRLGRDWAKLKDKICLDMISKSGCEETMRVLASTDGRPAVAEEAEAMARDIKEGKISRAQERARRRKASERGGRRAGPRRH